MKTLRVLILGLVHDDTENFMLIFGVIETDTYSIIVQWQCI